MMAKSIGFWRGRVAKRGLATWVKRYGLALLLSLGALLLRNSLSSSLRDSMLFAFSAIAIALSAGMGGLGPGLFATALSAALTLYWFIEPRGSFAIANSRSLGQLLTFLIIGGLLTLIIEALHRARRQAGAQAKSFRALFERASTGKALVDPATGRFALVNRKFSEITGYSEQQLIGMTFRHLTHPEDRAAAEACFERLVRGEIDEYAAERRHVRANGQVIWIELLVTLVRGDDGRPLHVFGSIQDISHRKQMEEALRESEARYRQVIRSAGNVIIGIDVAGRITMYNGQAQQVFGYTEKEVLGRHVVGAIVPPRDAAGRDMRALISDILRHSEQHLYNENENLTKDGRRLWMAWTNRPILESDGILREIICVGLDLTERKRIEDALRLSEERFRATYEYAPVGILQIALDGRLLDVNDALCRMLGYARQELLGRNINTIAHPDSLAAEKRPLEQLLLGETPSYQMEARYLRKEGPPLWVRVTTALTHLPHSYRIAVVEDISAQKQAEALQQERSFLRQVIDAAPSVIFVKNREGRYLLANEALARCYGFSVADMLGKTEADLNPHAGDVERFQRDDRQVISERRALLIPEEPATFPSGEVHWFSTSKAPLLNEDGSCDKVLVVGSDITERKCMEEALCGANEQLREANQRKDEFLAMLAHELRNPLAPMRNAIQVLRMIGSSDSAAIRQRDIIDRQVSHMARLLEDLLDVSRITRGRVVLQTRPLDLADVLAHAMEVTAPLIETRHQTLQVTLPPEELRVEGDVDRLAQVVGNLLANAAKYTDEGGQIWLEGRREAGHALISVRDSGMGIAPEMLPHVFELFAQADQSLARSRGGLGIGLTMVHKLVLMHGGSVEARSAGLGQGSEFRVRLPALPAPPPAPAHPHPGRADRGGAGQGEGGRPRRVLVVDDILDSAASLAELLEMWGHEARMTLDGHSALAAAREFHPEIVLLDIGMPVMDGYETARRLRAEHGPAMMLVALTGYGQSQDQSATQAAGFDHHMVKPVDIQALRDLLSTLLASHG